MFTYKLHYVQWRQNKFERGGTGPERKWGTDLAQSTGKIFYGVVRLHFLALKVRLVVLVSAFVVVSTVWSVLVCCSSAHGAPVPSHL